MVVVEVGFGVVVVVVVVVVVLGFIVVVVVVVVVGLGVVVDVVVVVVVLGADVVVDVVVVVEVELVLADSLLAGLGVEFGQALMQIRLFEMYGENVTVSIVRFFRSTGPPSTGKTI